MLKATKATKTLILTRKFLINQEFFLKFNAIKSLYFVEII